jgi:hypothetical protein
MDDSNILLKKNNEPEEAKIEIGGPKGLEPTRYGKDTPEWEVRGRVSDF